MSGSTTTSSPEADGTGGRMTFLDSARPSDADAAVVGGKAAGLIRMAAAGLPVPPGFVLGTGLCADYHARGGRLGEEDLALIERGIRHIERATGRGFGARRRPQLVSVRSGAAVSMPGMLDTILDVGLCEQTLPGLLRATGDPRFVWDSYRRLVESYAEVVDGCPRAPFAEVLDEATARSDVPSPDELDVAELQDVVTQQLARYRELAGHPFPQDPRQQLTGAVEAVLRSWDSPRAAEYRRLEHLSGLAGTAVTVQAMVFGNMGAASGAGVGFTRDPATGENRLYVDFLLNAQGEDVVGGRGAPTDSEPAIAAVPGLARGLAQARQTLESTFRDAQDFEFTVEDGTLWLLQARPAKRTPWAALQIACDLVDEGVVDQRTAVARLHDYDLDQIVRFRLAPGEGVAPVGSGTPASAGVASGQVALTVESAREAAGHAEPVILVREAASTDDIAGLAVCRGLLTASGARTSHAAVVARALGIACLVGCRDLAIDLPARSLRIGSWQGAERDLITIDAAAGRVYPGELRVAADRPSELIARVHAWESAG